MNSMHIMPLLPHVTIGIASAVVMLAIAAKRSHAITAALTVLGLGIAMLSIGCVLSLPSRETTHLLVVDNVALFYVGLMIVPGIVASLLGYAYFRAGNEIADEFYLLVLTTTFGACVLVCSTHFLSFFVGLETLTVSLYGLVAYTRKRPDSIEAGTKYLILAGGSAAFLVYGMALIYSATGLMDFGQIIAKVNPGLTDGDRLLLTAGFALMVVGIGFKLALVPFHLWTPDVYQGAPAPAAALVATVSKGAVFAVLLRYFTLLENTSSLPILVTIFTGLALLSMICGNLLALLQDNVKRILAYSSIANLGYLLVAFLATGTFAQPAAAFYLSAYFATVLGAFGVVSVLSTGERDADQIADYRGLYWRRPWLATMFTTMLLSLAGIPLTGGFFAKFFVLAAAQETSLWVLVLAVVICSSIGLFYYLRIIVAMCAPLSDGAPQTLSSRPMGLATGAALFAMTFAIVWMGVYPAPITHLVQSMTQTVSTEAPR